MRITIETAGRRLRHLVCLGCALLSIAATTGSAQAVPAVAITRSNAVTVLTWPFVAGHSNAVELSADLMDWKALTNLIQGNASVDFRMDLAPVDPTNLCSLLLYHWTNAAAWPVSLPLETTAVNFTNLAPGLHRFAVAAVYTSPADFLISGSVDAAGWCRVTDATGAAQRFYRVRFP